MAVAGLRRDVVNQCLEFEARIGSIVSVDGRPRSLFCALDR